MPSAPTHTAWRAAALGVRDHGDDAREANNHKCRRTPPEAQASHAAPDDGKWKLYAAWLVPGEELKRDEFDSALDHILASAGPSDIFL